MRHKLLEFLDAFGKGSLVDTYVLVLFVVAFSINMQCDQAPSPLASQICSAAGVGDAIFKLYVLPTIGFHTFLIATLMSLVNGLAMSCCHRYAHRIGEFGPSEDYERIEGLGNKRRLCSVLKDNSKFTALGVTVGLLISMALAVTGVFLTTFEFVFQGIAGLALGPEASVRAYSLFGLGEELPAASINPNTFGIHWIQFFFIVFSGLTVLIFLGLLLVLWNVPLTVKGQRMFLVIAQVMNAWSGLDVFVVAILACCLEISQFANFILSDVGLDAVNPYMPLIFSFSKLESDVAGKRRRDHLHFDHSAETRVFSACSCRNPVHWHRSVHLEQVQHSALRSHPQAFDRQYCCKLHQHRRKHCRWSVNRSHTSLCARCHVIFQVSPFVVETQAIHIFLSCGLAFCQGNFLHEPLSLSRSRPSDAHCPSSDKGCAVFFWPF